MPEVSIGAAFISTCVPSATPCKGFPVEGFVPLILTKVYCGLASAISVISLFGLTITRFAVLTVVGDVVSRLVTGSVVVPVGLATIW